MAVLCVTATRFWRDCHAVIGPVVAWSRRELWFVHVCDDQQLIEPTPTPHQHHELCAYGVEKRHSCVGGLVPACCVYLVVRAGVVAGAPAHAACVFAPRSNGSSEACQLSWHQCSGSSAYHRCIQAPAEVLLTMARHTSHPTSQSRWNCCESEPNTTNARSQPLRRFHCTNRTWRGGCCATGHHHCTHARARLLLAWSINANVTHAHSHCLLFGC
jgi:hypothetical protein